jgi:DNA-binding Lrp family transcriptional regulator
MLNEIEVDEKDRKILAILQSDARKTFKDIVEETKLSRGTVFNRMKELEEKGVIKGYYTIVDPAKLGMKVTALIMVQVGGGKLVEVENELASDSHVHYIYDITGEFDIAIVCRFKDTNQLSDFVKSLLSNKHITRTSTSIVLNVVKEDPKINLGKN